MIHHSAVVSNNTEIDETTNIGPFCIIGDGVKIGKNNNLISHVSIIGDTIIENNNTFYAFCSIGSEPQELKYNKVHESDFLSTTIKLCNKKLYNNHSKTYCNGNLYILIIIICYTFKKFNLNFFDLFEII